MTDEVKRKGLPVVRNLKEEFMTTEEKQGAWETETGLINDVDAWIKNARFGKLDEYAQTVAASGSEGGQMFIIDLVNEASEIIGSQGYSIGTGWEVSDDGMSIAHPKRKNVVGSSLYGQLQNRVVRDLKVDMEARGLPTEAKSWDGLGFHWKQQEHDTVGGKPATSVMPVEYLGEKKAGAAAVAKVAPAPTAESTTEKALGVFARTLDVKAFQEKALTMESVAADDELMAKVLDEGSDGFWATHQTK